VRIPRRSAYALAGAPATIIADLNRSAIMLRAKAWARSRRLGAAWLRRRRLRCQNPTSVCVRLGRCPSDDNCGPKQVRNHAAGPGTLPCGPLAPPPPSLSPRGGGRRAVPLACSGRSPVPPTRGRRGPRPHNAAFGRNHTRRKRRARHVTCRVWGSVTDRGPRCGNVACHPRCKPNRGLGLVCLARRFLRGKRGLARL